MSSIVINLQEYFPNSSVVSGRDAGQRVRSSCHLDDLDRRNETIEITIPKTIQTVTASFFGGLLSSTIRLAGNASDVYRRVQLKVESTDGEAKERAIRSTLEREVQRVLTSDRPLIV